MKSGFDEVLRSIYMEVCTTRPPRASVRLPYELTLAGVEVSLKCHESVRRVVPRESPEEGVRRVSCRSDDGLMVSRNPY